MANSWQQIKKAALKTGREAIVVDGDHILVVMTLARYDELLSKEQDVKQLSKEELLEKINRQIAEWHASQTETDESMAATEKKSRTNLGQSSHLQDLEKGDDDEAFYIEPVSGS